MKSKNIYRVPFQQEELFLAVSNPEVHNKEYNNENAIDFIISPKTKILSSLEGVVTDVKDDSNLGGNDLKFGNTKYQNYITLKHTNGEYSQYIHLAHNSSLVKKGDKVKAGQPIARSIGMVGYTTFPHIHFEVFDENEKSLEINFGRNKFEIYTSKNIQEEIRKSKYKNLIKKCEELVTK
jgi:murein DD-endopeptidase MepM/ murein hydrolase activator NlpD